PILVVRRRLVLELVRRGDERAVAQAVPVERREAQMLNGQRERRLAAAGRRRALDEERTEAFGGALDRPELGVELIDEGARGARDGQRGDVGEQRARDRLARRLRRGPIDLGVAGGDAL